MVIRREHKRIREKQEKTINFVICNTYHKDHLKQADVVNSYYKRLGYVVDSFPVNFIITPEHECRNSFFERNPEADYIIYLDTDEVLLLNDLQTLTKALETNKDVYKCQITDYIGKDSIVSERIHRPIVAVINRVKHNKKVKFKYNRNVSGCESYEEIPISIHHLGYLINPAWKLKNYRERNEFHEIGVVESVIKQNGIKVNVPIEVATIIKELNTL